MRESFPPAYEFGPFLLDAAERMLWNGNEVIALSPKAFDLLFALVDKAGRVVDKDELMSEVWPDAFVEQNNLTVNISALRKALEEVSSDRLYIQTVPRRGYRFTASVRRRERSTLHSPARPGAFTDSNTLVGRDPELRKLEGFLHQAIEGAGRTVFITGEAGIGKTALAEEFMRLAARRQQGLMLARGRALEQYGAGEAYLPFLDALSGLLRNGGDIARTTLRAHAPTWCLQLPAFSSNTEIQQLRRETAGATKDRMLREMGDALGVLSESAPLVLLLEDLHWADAPSIDLLRRLCQRIAGRRVLLLATFRPEDLQTGNHPLKNCKVELQAHQECKEIALGVLGVDSVTNLLDKRFHPNEFPRELASVIHRRTDGQPLFTLSLLEFLASQGDIANTNSHWKLARHLGA